MSVQPIEPKKHHRSVGFELGAYELARLRTCRLLMMLVVSIFICAGCGRAGGTGAASDQRGASPGTTQPLLISSEDILTVRSNALASGPSITGSVQPERRADLRAEISAIVLSVLKTNGDSVRRGEVLVRLDDTAIRETLTAAEFSARASEQAYDQAERQLQRLKQLRETGLVTVLEVEEAEGRRNAARSEREAARTTVVAARQQLQRTEVRAPFAGIVSERKVSAGDTAQVGKELLKVIDPHSLRFEGLMSADYIGEVEIGQRVSMRVQGFSEEFFGTITGVNPAASITTRQVEVLVAFEDANHRPEVAGLYAEGRVETTRTSALTIPASALVREGNDAFAWRVRNGALEKVALRIGERDPRTGEFVLNSGLAEGDALIRYPTSALQDGQPIELVRADQPVSTLAEGTRDAGSGE